MTQPNACNYACQSPEHRLARRSFLSGMALGLGGMAASGLSSGGLVSPLGLASKQAIAGQLQQRSKRMIMIWLSGGVSQLETWDPKPGTDTGGPFRAISTSVPGIQISELLPFTAQQMHHMSLVRSINTAEDDHGKGAYIMHTGRKQDPASVYPHLGAVAAKYLTPADNPLPGYIHITPGGSGMNQSDAAFLGPKYGAVILGNGQAPANTARYADLAPEVDAARQSLRRQVSEHFSARRRTAQTQAYTYSYEQALQLMEKRELFDVSKEPAADQERYGAHDFGRHCLLARRLIENGVTFVKVDHSNYDTHNENFIFHIEQLGEFDKPFALLISDLAERGLLEDTLVVVNSEFGRTPTINHLAGRDHWGHAWSIAMAGGKLQRGAVIGKTNANGTVVEDRQVHGGHLFHTYLKAVGINSMDEFVVDGRPIQIADPTASPIDELLA